MRWNASFNNKNVDFEQLPEQKSDGSGGVMVVTLSEVNDGAKSENTKAVVQKTYVADKTASEIMTAYLSGGVVVEKDDEYYTVVKAFTSGEYHFSFVDYDLYAESADDYPTVIM